MSPALLTPAEAAQHLGVSRGWVYRHARAGTLPAVRLGEGPRAPLRLDPVELRDWLRGAGSPVEGATA